MCLLSYAKLSLLQVDKALFSKFSQFTTKTYTPAGPGWKNVFKSLFCNKTMLAQLVYKYICILERTYC